jgi:hypothetical protein
VCSLRENTGPEISLFTRINNLIPAFSSLSIPGSLQHHGGLGRNRFDIKRFRTEVISQSTTAGIVLRASAFHRRLTGTKVPDICLISLG